MIMVGPGTGIAPFRAFLEERQAARRHGQELALLRRPARAPPISSTRTSSSDCAASAASCTRLDTAFSRDQAEKVYVQTACSSAAAELWHWLEDGAHFYVCGDAKRMAKDVDDTLIETAIEQGGKSADAARAWLDGLAKAGRYQRDVY